jgi:hypothetical protein
MSSIQAGLRNLGVKASFFKTNSNYGNLSDELEGFFYAEKFNLAKRAPT